MNHKNKETDKKRWNTQINKISEGKPLFLDIDWLNRATSITPSINNEKEKSLYNLR